MKQSPSLDKNWLEWLVFAIGLGLVTGVIGYLAFAAVTLGSAPPDIKIQLGTPQPEGEYFRVPVSVRNDGDQTAEAVHIEVVLNEDKATEETASFETAFLPRHSSRNGAVTFQTDPRNGKLKARVLGYEKP